MKKEKQEKEGRAAGDMERVTERPLMGLKAIAAYLQKSERTLQRYRRLKGFPMYHRRGIGTFYAFPSELNAWLKNR